MTIDDTQAGVATTLPALQTVHGRVAAVRQLAPNLLEVTVSGFDDVVLSGGDEFVYALVSTELGGIRPGYEMATHLARVAGDPVRGAYYTVRRSRPAVGEIDLWVVAHGHPGSVGAWMASASPGDPLALWGPRRGFVVPDDAQHLLLVADETGFAAVAALLEVIGRDRRVTAVLECPDADHRPPMPPHPGARLVWVDRGEGAPGVHNRLLPAVSSNAIAVDAVFGAAESRHIAAIRSLAGHVLGIASASTSMTGYWRRSVA